VVSTPLKNIRQNGNLPQVGVKKNIWNYHLVIQIITCTHSHVYVEMYSTQRPPRAMPPRRIPEDQHGSGMCRRCFVVPLRPFLLYHLLLWCSGKWPYVRRYSFFHCTMSPMKEEPQHWIKGSLPQTQLVALAWWFGPRLFGTRLGYPRNRLMGGSKI